ncbi:hypothetical protein [Bradyrhizobium sp.]|nr:hypothetical protein [Bradyrhizobium sp.]
MEIRREAAASLTASRLAQTSILVHDGRSPCRSIRVVSQRSIC